MLSRVRPVAGPRVVERYRLDWSGRRYVVHTAHRRALVLDEPLRLTLTFEDLQLP